MGNTNHTTAPGGRSYILQQNPDLSRAFKLNRWAEYRERKRILTQKEFAGMNGFSRSWISRLESGIIVPDIIQFMCLTQSLGLGASLNAVYEDAWLVVGKNLKKNKSFKNL